MLSSRIREVFAALGAMPVFGIASSDAGFLDRIRMLHRSVMSCCGDHRISKSNLMLCGRIGEVLAALRAMPVFDIASSDAGCGLGIMMLEVMTQRRNLYVCAVFTAVTIAGIVAIPAYFSTGCGLGIMMLEIVT